MKIRTDAAAVAAACAVCCAPLVVAAAAVVPPGVVAGAAATAVGAGIAGLVRRRGRSTGQRASRRAPGDDAGLTGSEPA